MKKGYQFVWTNPFSKPDETMETDMDAWFYVRKPCLTFYHTAKGESLYYIFDWILVLGYLQIRKWSTKKFEEDK